MKSPMSQLRLTILLLSSLLASSLPVDPALAQRGGDDRRERGDDRRGEDGDRRAGRDDDRRRGRDEDRRRWGREPDDQQSVQREAERRREFMSRLDRNRDGTITREEVGDRWWGRIEEQAQAAGLDTSGPISLEGYLNARQSQETTRLRERQRTENPTAFLEPIERPPAPGFDQPLSDSEQFMLHPDRPQVVDMTASGEAGSQTTTQRASGSAASESRDDRTERYASSLIERYDKNGNKILEQDEWKEMRGNPGDSDKNNDGRITKDELIARFSRFRGGSDEGSRGGSGSADDRRERSSRDRGTSSDRDQEDDARATYRFTSAMERLPKDARSWVERYDKNGDAQVSMAEFSSSWSDSKLREYEKYDLNQDGVVTGEEYLASKQR